MQLLLSEYFRHQDQKALESKGKTETKKAQNRQILKNFGKLENPKISILQISAIYITSGNLPKISTFSAKIENVSSCQRFRSGQIQQSAPYMRMLWSLLLFAQNPEKTSAICILMPEFVRKGTKTGLNCS